MTRPLLRNRFEFYVDAWLLIVFLLLLSPRLTGLPIHEWLGIALVLGVVVHLLLSWAWISTGTRSLLTRSTLRSRINYLLNWLLFILIFVEIVSGLGISAVALPAFGVDTINDRSWRALHNQTLNVTHVVIGLHVAMNWHALLAGFRRHILLRPAARE